MKKQIILSIIAAIVLSVIVIAGAVYLLRGNEQSMRWETGESSSPTPSAEFGAAETTEVPRRPDCQSTGVGEVELECLGGNKGNHPQEQSGLTVVNVWAWWCAPCREELPYFEQFAAQHPEITVVGVHADTNAEKGAALLEELNLNLVSYQDSDNSFAGALGLPGVIPLTLVFHGTEQVAMFATAFESTEELTAAVAKAAGGAL